ncbi:MAG: transketolase C-terminal domain-containing protein [Candidatus Ozemobacteraceae bacterium]
MRKAFAETMNEVGQIDQRLVVLVGDISHGILRPFSQNCPGRFYNVGILEPTIVSMAAGLYHAGFFPVAHTIAPFLIERSFEQIKLDFCYQERGGTLISVGSAFDYAGLGCSHHCYDDLGLMKFLPRTEVMYPTMPNEFRILFTSTYRNDRLTYFRLPEEKHNVLIPDEMIQFGKGILLREGTDVTILVLGPQLKTVIEAIPVLSNRGISAEVLYYPTIKPFDEELLSKSLRKTGKILVIEEHMVFGGINEDVLRSSCNFGNVRYSFINIPNSFLKGYGSYQEHCNSLGFTAENIVNRIVHM